jgi:hypothetical protein
MNYKGEVTAPWGDGEHLFKLSVAGLLELEEKTKNPFAVIFARVNGGAYSVPEISETLRLGLIGGGKSPIEAKTLVDRYLLPLAESAPVARLVLMGVMFGFEASQPGKQEAAPGAAETMNASTPQQSSETQDSSASAPMSLAEFHSGNWWQS